MNICFFSGSRSEYGLNNFLLRSLRKHKKNKIKLAISGLRKNSFLGMSELDIKKDNFRISKNIYLNLNNTSSLQVSKNFSKICEEMSIYFNKNKFDIAILIGDRYETLAVALAAYINRVPIAHIHGGEKTIDSLDDNYRHCISKLSNLHFVSHTQYKKRLIQLGEEKKNIHVVGGLGSEIIKNFSFLDKSSLEKNLKIKFKKKILVVNFYPELKNLKISYNNLEKILNSLVIFKNCSIIFTFPTHEVGAKKFINKIKKFSLKKENCFYFYNLGHKKFLSLLKYSNIIIGNSSSGILEMPSLGGYTLNIGNRQAGRLMSKSVISCNANSNKITNLIKKLLRKKKHKIRNIYYKKDTSKKIVRILKRYNLKKLNNFKIFNDLKII